jgi:hypothetical protein
MAKKAKKKTTSAKHRPGRSLPVKKAVPVPESVVFPSDGEIDESCPLCAGRENREEQGLDAPIDGVSVKHWQDEFERIKAEHPEWDVDRSPCVRCIAYYGMERAGRAGEET